ncbi:MAG TPA: tetratricopeptide repeat protein [Candidatus Sulfotelmatobacter sp.]|nr:tetratricopeptide repeat protein [Candidatus Sulfotelmatobacter sp.]
MTIPGATYHFGKFRLQTADRRLTSEGREIYLRPKTYETLLYLLDHHGHLVSKEELLNAVWADVEVTENALTHCIKEVRAALDDKVQNPEFIRTIPRLGYEFVRDVEASNEATNEEIVEEFRTVHLVTTEEDSDVDASAPTSIIVVPAPAVARRQLTSRNVAFAAVVLLGLCAGAYEIWSSRDSERSVRGSVADVLSWFGYRATQVLAPRDYVLISDFDNQTGDPVFDRSLATALATSLDQSSAANVYSPARVRETLRRMQKPNIEHINEDLALEIAEREGIKAIVLPTITSVGQSYRLAACIRAVSSGRDIKTEVARASSKDRVLDAVDELAAALRKDLGESLQRISESKPLAAVTTPSLEALRQYALGVEKQKAADVQDAKTYYENALAIDPNFTMARASLGVLHLDWAAGGIAHFDAKEGKRLLTEAVQHTSNLTDKEKYPILASYAQWVENDSDKAVHYYKALLAIYPDYPEAYNNLARIYRLMGRREEAIAAAKQAIRIDPYLLIAYANLAAVQLYEQSDVKSGLETCQQALRVDPHNAWSYDCVGWASFGKGDWVQAQAAFEKAVFYNPQYTLSRYRLAHAYRLQGHYQQALQTLESLLRIDPSDPTPWYDMGVVCQAMGDQDKAREYLQHYQREMEARLRKRPNDADAIWNLAELFSRMGEMERASFWTRKGLALDPNRHFEYALVLSLNQHKPAAIDELRVALQMGYPYPIFIKIHPDLQALHGEANFEQLLASVIKN